MMPQPYALIVKVLISLVAAISLIAFLYGAGFIAGKKSIQSEWDKEKAAQIQEAATIKEENRIKEREWAHALQQSQDEYIASTEAARVAFDSDIAAVRSDNLKLRNQFRGCRDRVPENTGAVKSNDEASEGGLSREDQELALRIGSDADQVAIQLTSCQAYVRSLTKE